MLHTILEISVKRVFPGIDNLTYTSNMYNIRDVSSANFPWIGNAELLGHSLVYFSLV